MNTDITFIIADNQDITRMGMHGYISAIFSGCRMIDVTDKNRIAGLSAELMAQAEQYAVVLGVQAYLEFTRTLSPEMNAELEGHKDNEVPET